jgi:hypothetical protein
MKWTEGSDKQSLQQAQAVLAKKLATIKAIDGFKSVQRVVCGGCHDLKVKLFPRASISAIHTANFTLYPSCVGHHRC